MAEFVRRGQKGKAKMVYTPELGRIALRILARSNDGFEALYRDHKQEGFPNPTKFYRWLTNHQDFAQGYVLAKRVQAQRLAMENITIPDELFKKGQASQADVSLAKLRAESRRWAASRLSMKEWGDRLELRGDEDAPLFIHSWLDLSNLAEEKD